MKGRSREIEIKKWEDVVAALSEHKGRSSLAQKNLPCKFMLQNPSFMVLWEGQGTRFNGSTEGMGPLIGRNFWSERVGA